MWVQSFASLFCSERFFPRVPRFSPFHQKPEFDDLSLLNKPVGQINSKALAVIIRSDLKRFRLTDQDSHYIKRIRSLGYLKQGLVLYVNSKHISSL